MRPKKELVTFSVFMVRSEQTEVPPNLVPRILNGDLSAWHKLVVVANWRGFSARAVADGLSAASREEAVSSPVMVGLKDVAYELLCAEIDEEME